jgi:segregation and condensation protein A
VAIQLQLHLEAFDGPLELLLLLIEQRRLPITQVSLAQLADQYLAQVHALPEVDPELLSEFLQVGGKLLLLKSRALLLTEEPDAEAEEIATDLAERLATYRVFRAAAERLRELEQRNERLFTTAREPLVSTTPAPLTPLTSEALLNVWRRLQEQPRQTSMALPLAVRVNVDERRALILDGLRDAGGPLSFRALAGSTIDEVIATFLAVLELFRRALIEVEQSEAFGDLLLSRRAGPHGQVG